MHGHGTSRRTGSSLQLDHRTATDNLLDRIADIAGRNYEIGRLGEGNSVFDSRRVELSFTDQARRIAGRDAKKAVINKAVDKQSPRGGTQ